MKTKKINKFIFISILDILLIFIIFTLSIFNINKSLIKNNLINKTNESIMSYKQVELGGDFSGGVLNDGTTDHLYMWGANDHGQLGLGDNDERKIPTEVTTGKYALKAGQSIKQLAFGNEFSMALVTDGSGDHLYSWGRNNKSQLGLGDDYDLGHPDVNVPTKVDFEGSSAKKPIKQIEAGKDFSLAVLYDDGLETGKEGDDLYIWGNNDKHQIDSYSFQSYNHPLWAKNLSKIKNKTMKMYAGRDFSSAIVDTPDDKNVLYVWGNNDCGQLGNDEIGGVAEEAISIEIPLQQEIKEIKELSLGGDFSSAVVNDGTVDHLFTWGSNEFGQLGNNEDGTNVLTPTEITKDSYALTKDDTIKQISAGDEYMSAIVNDGTKDHLYSWGKNSDGQLGIGSAENVNVPTEVEIGTEIGDDREIEQISLGQIHSSSIVRSNGGAYSIYLWGSDKNSRLGDGKTKDQTSPLIIDGLSAKVEDPTDVTFTSDGGDFIIKIIDGTGLKVINDFNISMSGDGDFEVDGGNLAVGNNHIIVTGLSPANENIITITLTSNFGDVVKNIDVSLGTFASVDDPQNMSLTSDGAEFNVVINDGTIRGEVTGFSLTAKSKTGTSTDVKVEADDGAGLKIGNNSVVVSKMVPGEKVIVTIKLTSNLDPITKDIEIELGKSAVIGEPTDIVWTDDGEKFNVNLTDGTLNGVVTNAPLTIDNGYVNVEGGGDLVEGDNTIIVSGLIPGDEATVTITLESGLEDVVREINLTISDIARSIEDHPKAKDGSIKYNEATIVVSVSTASDSSNDSSNDSIIQPYKLIVRDTNSDKTWTTETLTTDGEQEILIDGLSDEKTYQLSVEIEGKEKTHKTVDNFTTLPIPFELKEDSFVLQNKSSTENSFIFSIGIKVKQDPIYSEYDISMFDYNHNLHLYSNGNELKLEFVQRVNNNFTFKAIELNSNTNYSDFEFSIHEDGSERLLINDPSGRPVSVKTKWKRVTIITDASILIVILVIMIISAIVIFFVVRRSKNNRLDNMTSNMKWM